MQDLNVDLEKHHQVLSVEDPPVRKAGIKVDSVEMLIAKLKADGVLP